MSGSSEIFVTGGSGEIGRPALAALAGRGHRVRSSVRDRAGAEIVSALGAEPVAVDLFDREAVIEAAAGADAILHLATAIPPSAEMGDLANWETNDRLRAETTAHLAAAVGEYGGRLVLQSYFGVGRPRGDEWIEEAADRERDFSGIGVMESMRDAEAEALAVGGVVLRFGSLYSETSEQLQAQVEGLLAGEAAVGGEGDNFWPYLDSADAGAAAAAALEIEPGIYDVNDGEPLALSEFWRIAAAAVEAPPPPKVDVDGHPMAPILLGSWRASDAAFREASGWRPRERTREGWPAAAGRYRAERPARRPLVQPG